MRKIIAANWKMYKSPNQAKKYFQELRSQLQILSEQEKLQSKKLQFIFFPSACNWETTGHEIRNFPADITKHISINWGPQNAYVKTEGAFTGENSPQVAKELGAHYVLVGHSERRKIFAENDELISIKLGFFQELSMTPMLCIGESLQERESGKTQEVNETQLRRGLQHWKKSDIVPMIAYEPVWAIGTGKVASTQQVAQAHNEIRQVLKSLDLGEAPILYGGSVKPENAAELLSIPNVDGFLVGGASLEVSSLLKIAQLN